METPVNSLPSDEEIFRLSRIIHRDGSHEYKSGYKDCLNTYAKPLLEENEKLKKENESLHKRLRNIAESALRRAMPDENISRDIKFSGDL